VIPQIRNPKLEIRSKFKLQKYEIQDTVEEITTTRKLLFCPLGSFVLSGGLRRHASVFLRE
jgi:hypothetical protein